jgi:hypothetical protein
MPIHISQFTGEQIDDAIAHNAYVGVAYNIITDSFVRLGAAQAWPTGRFPGVHISPIFQRLRRVVLADNGTVYKGISWTDPTKHEDGSDVDLTGGNGQVMVEFLPAYCKTGVWGNWYYLLISHLPLDGFELHPVFDGVDAVYLGAYEAAVYNNMFCSIAKSPVDGISPVFPATTRAGAWGHAGLTTQAGDTLSAARGAGWQQADFLTHNWLRLLMLVGFAGYNFQSLVGNGRSSLSGGVWENDSYIGRCGLSNAAAGYHSAVQVGGAGGYLTDYSQVFGVENIWGDVWDRVVSLVSDHAVYYKALPPYDYTSLAGWTRLTDALGVGITIPQVNGYAGRPHTGLGLVLPADVTGTSSTKMADYFYQAAGLRVFLVGGGADSGASAGPFFWHAGSAAAGTNANVGGRLCFKKT